MSFYYKVNNFNIPSDSNPYIATDTFTNGKHIVTLTYPFTNFEAYAMVHFEVHMIVQNGYVTVPARTTQGTFFGQELTDTSGFGGAIRVEENYLKHTVEISGMGVADNITHGDMVITHIVDPDETPYVPMDNQLVTIDAIVRGAEDDISLYNIASMSSKPIAEDSVITPALYLYGGLKLISEDGLYLAAEDDDRFITENQGAPE